MNSLLVLALLMATPEAPANQGFDTLVVCPQPYVAAMQPWFDYRMKQGHRIGVVTDTSSKEAIRTTIREAAEAGPLQQVLLVGDAIADQSDAIGVPVHYQKAVVNVLFGSEPEIPTDNFYADLNDDQIPDIAVGRFSVSSEEELKTIVAKTLAYETKLPSGDWQRRLHFVAGLGGFGSVVDTLMESVTKKFLTDEIPAHFDAVVAQGSWQSIYCPDPREFRDEVLKQLNDGGLFWVYMGHGHVEHLDYVRVPNDAFPIFSNNDALALRNERSNPIAIFLACYTGAFDAPRDCLAERLHRAKGGPVAVYAGSRVTMPYAMGVMGTEMLQQYFVEKQPTLGQLILHAKQETIRQSGKSGNRKMLDTMASLVSPKPKLLREERLEHMALFNLLGDPLLKLPHASPVEIEAPKVAEPGQTIEIAGTTEIAGKVHVELVCRRDGCVETLAKRALYDARHDQLASYNQTYQSANDRCWESVEVLPVDGNFTTRLLVPEACEGPCHVRVWVEGASQVGLGSHDIEIRSRPAKPQTEGELAGQ
ncbi:C25 family cysteine peptidase [Bremerella sp. JC817]|uniref:C25 family cysteine peptidase n=1 Tax=Bremerella sp. JC817 TaxID=3231756 RepID=UPI00345A7169